MREPAATQAAVPLLFVFSALKGGGGGGGNSGAAEPIKNLVTSGRSGRRSRRNIVRKNQYRLLSALQ